MPGSYKQLFYSLMAAVGILSEATVTTYTDFKEALEKLSQAALEQLLHIPATGFREFCENYKAL
jgi:hypothetical protein